MADMWILELDIIPWLLSTAEGTERLTAVIEESRPKKKRARKKRAAST